MTVGEACTLLVDTVRDLAAARGERDGYRLVALTAVRLLHERHVEFLQLRDRHERLIEEYRRYRAATICSNSSEAA